MKILLSVFLFFFPIIAVSAEKAKNELNFLTWAGYIKPEFIKQFEQETGIKVKVDYADSHYILESKIIAPHNNYDVTVPTLAPFFLRQVQFGLFQPLDHKKLKNYKYIDPKIIAYEKAANNSDKYSIPFLLDSVGIGFDYNKIKDIMPTAPTDSLSFVFDPDIIKNFTSCGIEMLDSPEEIISLVMIYLGMNPNSESEDDLQKVASVLRKIRPFISSINSNLYFNNLGSGDNCLVIGYAGDITHTKHMSQVSGNNLDIRYTLPKEGSIMTLDLMAIPTTAPNKENAYKFLDFIMRPSVNASIANSLGFTSINLASYPLIKKEFINNPNIYPLLLGNTKLHILHIPSPKYNRLRNRVWIKFITDEWGD